MSKKEKHLWMHGVEHQRIKTFKTPNNQSIKLFALTLSILYLRFVSLLILTPSSVTNIHDKRIMNNIKKTIDIIQSIVNLLLIIEGKCKFYILISSSSQLVSRVRKMKILDIRNLQQIGLDSAFMLI